MTDGRPNSESLLFRASEVKNFATEFADVELLVEILAVISTDELARRLESTIEAIATWSGVVAAAAATAETY